MRSKSKTSMENYRRYASNTNNAKINDMITGDYDPLLASLKRSAY